MTSFVPENAVVWAEIPVTDMDRAKAFYGAVLDNMPADQNDSPNPVAVFVSKQQSAVAGHLYPGKPAASGSGNTIHLAAAAPLEDALKRVADNGGTVVSPVIDIPAGRFAYCLDPDGNSIGIFCA